MPIEYIQTITSITTSIAVLIAMVIGYRLLVRFLDMRERENKHEYILQKEAVQKSSRAPSEPSLGEPIVDTSGYIVINLPDSEKTLFMDLLKGFEEYAVLKGYNISFSYDGSLPNKVAFRFMIVQGGIAVSTEKVKEDIQEYIRKVQNGDTFDDVDIVITPEKHHITLMILKNRLAFLQTTYVTQRNALQLYENLIKTFGESPFATRPQQFFIQGGGYMNPSQYTAVNSQQIAQGQGIKMIGNAGTLNIGTTFNEKQELAQLFDRVVNALLREKGETQQQAYEARRYVERAKEEVCEEPRPDETRLRRYLEKAKEFFSTATFAKDAIDAFRILLQTIGMS